MYHSLLIHSPTEGHLGWFQVFSITNKFTKNIRVRVFPWREWGKFLVAVHEQRLGDRGTVYILWSEKKSAELEHSENSWRLGPEAQVPRHWAASSFPSKRGCTWIWLPTGIGLPFPYGLNPASSMVSRCWQLVHSDISLLNWQQHPDCLVPEFCCCSPKTSPTGHALKRGSSRGRSLS